MGFDRRTFAGDCGAFDEANIKMRNLVRWAVLAASLLSLCSCGLFSSEQIEAAISVINQLSIDGKITVEQAEAMRQALLANTGEPWYMQVGKMVLEIGLAVVGVRIWRGPAATVAERVARRSAA